MNYSYLDLGAVAGGDVADGPGCLLHDVHLGDGDEVERQIEVSTTNLVEFRTFGCWSSLAKTGTAAEASTASVWVSLPVTMLPRVLQVEVMIEVAVISVGRGLESKKELSTA